MYRNSSRKTILMNIHNKKIEKQGGLQKIMQMETSYPP